MATFTVELVTPEKLLLSEEVEMVEVPGSEGDFGVLAFHAPMIASLRLGVVKTSGADKSDEKVFFVAGGFAEVANNRCTILADEALPVSELNADKARKRLEDAEFSLKHAETESEKARATQEKTIAEAQLGLLKAA
ncbi:MAG: atpC [Rickettsiales bacterium]|jgi:F-type H+-transporting ATPase subunit epsilon|nr:atpC [Rickettsiales bacterium]